MKKRRAPILLLLALAVSLAGCSGFGPLDQLEESEAMAIIMFVYSELNSYAISGPGEYGSVHVEDDYHADPMNAIYTNDVTVEFDQFTSAENTIDGTGLVAAYMDSYNGRYGAAYSGTFTGQFEGAVYRIVIDYESWNAAESGIGSEGSFTVNRQRYEIGADSNMVYDYFGL